jgi:hypothetical protein
MNSFFPLNIITTLSFYQDNFLKMFRPNASNRPFPRRRYNGEKAAALERARDSSGNTGSPEGAEELKRIARSPPQAGMRPK